MNLAFKSANEAREYRAGMVRRKEQAERHRKSLSEALDALSPFADERPIDADHAMAFALRAVIAIQISQLEESLKDQEQTIKKFDEQLALAESGLVIPGGPMGRA